MSFRFVLVLASLCLCVAAQVGKQGNDDPRGQGRPRPPIKQQESIDLEAGEDGGKTGDEKAQEEGWENLTPEQRLERNIRNGASSYCTFAAGVRPSRLLPGQSGTLYVTAILKGAAVLSAPTPLQVTSPATQGLIMMGAPSFHPARNGTPDLSAGFLGRPVYDNTAIFEIPVTMSKDAVLGTKQAVHVDMKFDLFDAKSAQVVGRFVDRATAEIEVGHAADPAVTTRARATAGNAPAAGSSASVKGSNDDGAVAVPDRPDALDGVVAMGASDSAQTPVMAPVGESQALPSPESGGGRFPLMLLGGGMLVIVILVLMVMRR